jgi:hypothetical protein
MSVNREELDRMTGLPENSVDANLRVLLILTARTFEKQGLSRSAGNWRGERATPGSMPTAPAGELFADVGLWGVERTAKWIYGFAVMAIGNEPANLDAVRDCLAKGYAMAERGFGETLPEASMETLKAVIYMLDEWSKERLNARRLRVAPIELMELSS